jgi:hypothetical protein
MYAGDMQLIIRRTVTWQDDQETIWQATQEVAGAIDSEPGEAPLEIRDDDQADSVLALDSTDQTADDE